MAPVRKGVCTPLSFWLSHGSAPQGGCQKGLSRVETDTQARDNTQKSHPRLAPREGSLAISSAVSLSRVPHRTLRRGEGGRGSAGERTLQTPHSALAEASRLNHGPWLPTRSSLGPASGIFPVLGIPHELTSSHSRK